MKNNLLKRISLLAGTSALLLACGFNAAAADRTWDGGDTTPSANWSAVANWDGDLTTPTNADNLIFTGANQTYNVNDIANLTLGWILFDAPGFSVSGSSLTLSGGLTNSANAGGATVDANLNLSGAQTIVSESGALTLNGAVTNGTNVLTVDGSGDVYWPMNATQGIKGTGNLVKNGSGTLVWTGTFVNGSVAYAYTGNTIVNGGTLDNQSSSWSANSAMGASLTVNPGATFNNNSVHFMSYDGRPITNYGGTINLNQGGYVASITLSNATINGAGGMSCNLNGSRDVTVLAAGNTSTIGAGITLSTAYGAPSNVGSRTFNVADGAADPDLECSGFINGVGSLTKTGPGKMTLSGAGTYAGATIISAGTLALTGGGTIANSTAITLASNTVFDVAGVYYSLSTNQTLSGFGTVIGTVYDNNPGATLTPGGSAAAGTLTLDSLNLSGILALSFDLSANANAIGGGTNDLLSVTNLTLSSFDTNAVSLNALGGSLTQGVPYTLIKYINCSAPAGSVATLAAPPSHFVYTFNNDTANSRITVTVTGNPFNLTWKGDGVSNNWDIVTTPNWINAGTNIVYWDGDNATFSDTGSNTPPVNVATTVKPTTVTVNATKDYTFAGNGKISGGAKLVKSNSGNLTFLTPNDNSGGGSLNGSGVITVGAGGNLGSGSLTNNTTVLFNPATGATVTYAGNMTGTGKVAINAPAGTVNFSGVSTLPGGVLVNNGTLQIGNAPTVAGASIAGPITNYAGVIFSRTDAFTNQSVVTSAGNPRTYGDGNVTVRGAGGMTVDGTASLNAGGGLVVGSTYYGKLTINSGAVVSVGSGSYTVGGSSGIAGDVIQNGGTVTVNTSGANKGFPIGLWGSEISTYTVNGGLLDVPNGTIDVGSDGIGLMFLNGGTVNCRQLYIDNNGATAAIGTTNSMFTMTGGNLNVGVSGIANNTSTVRLFGGTIAAAAPAGFSSSTPMILTNGAPTIDSSNSVITLSGILSGNGGLTKQGSGYLNLNGVNTYTNTTAVAAGTLQGSGTIVAPVVVQSGANLSAGGVLAAGTLTVSNVTMNSGASLLVDASSTAATSDQIVARGTLALDGVGTLAKFNFLGGTPFTGGPYTIVTNLVPRSGNLVVSNPTRYVATVDQSNPNRIQVSFTGANANLVWKGNVNNQWDVNNTANWLNGAAADKYFQSDVVVFDGTGIAAPNVTLAADMTPASVHVNTSGNYTFSGGGLTGLGSLNKNGTGTLTLANNNTFTGGAFVNAGILQIGNGGTTGFVGGNIINNGNVVFNRSDLVTYGINPANAGAAVISGPGNLTQAGSGTLLIVNTMTYLGGTTINPGSTLQLGNGPIIDSGSLGSSPTTNNGTINFYRLSNVSVATPFAGNGAFNFLGTGLGGQSGYILGGTNTFTGPVTVTKARIQSGAGALSFGAPSSITINPGAQVYAVATPASPVYNIPLTLNGSGWLDGFGALRLENGGTWSGPITLADKARICVNNSTTNTITGTITGANELDVYCSASPAMLTLAPVGVNSFNALRVSGGTGPTVIGNANAVPSGIPLYMNGGTLRLNGFDKSFGATTLAGGQIQNGSDTSAASVTLVPPQGAVTVTSTFADGASKPLHITLTQSSPWTMTLGNLSASWTGNLTNNGGNIVVGTGTSMLGNNNAPNRYLVVNKGGSLVWNVNNVFGGGTANTYFPTIVLNGGSAISNNNYNVIGPVVLNGASLAGVRNSTGYRRYQFRGPVTVIGSMPSTIAGSGFGSGDHLDTATVFNVADVTGNANPDLIVTDLLANRSGDYGGTGGLIKSGAGTMELDGANIYTGSTVISNGVLSLGASASLASSASITLVGGSTLDASALSDLTLGSQSLGGSGTVKGNLTLNGTGSLLFKLNSTSTTVGGGVNDLIQVNGNLTLNDSAPMPVKFNFLNGPNAAGTYTIMQYTGALSGTAAGLTNTQGYAVTFTVGGGVVQATFAAAPQKSIVWAGDGGANEWNTDTASVNWVAASMLTNFNQFDAVTFDASTANNTVTLTAEVRPTSITINGASDYLIQKSGAGTITGTNSITKNGTGTATLDIDPNPAVGPINVNAGVLKYGGNNNSYAGATTITVANNAALDFGADWDMTQTQPHDFVVQGSGPDGLGAVRATTADIYSYTFIRNFTLAGNTVLGGAYRWDIGPQAGSKVDGQGYPITWVGAGTLDFRCETITNLPSITVSNGLVYYENYSQTNPATATTTNIVTAAGRLGNLGTVNNMPIVLDGGVIQSSGGTPVWTGPVTLQSSSLVRNNASQAFVGPIGGTGAMWVDGGTAALTLSNANTYAGGTIISNAPYTLTNSPAVAGLASVIVKHPNAFGVGSVAVNGLSAVALTTNGSYFLTNVLRAVEFGFAAPGTVPNNFILPANTISNVSLQGRDSGQAINLSGVISGGFTGMTNWIDFGDATAVGVMRYGNTANTFTGTIGAFRGNLAITADGSLGAAANVLRLAQASTTAGLRFDAPAINVAHAVSVTAATTVNLFGDNNGDGVPETVNNATISGIVSGAGGTLNLRGTNGVLTLSGFNTYSGSIELPEPAVLQVAASTNLGTAAVAIKAGTFRYTGTGSETMTRSLWNDTVFPTFATIDITSPTAALTWNAAGGTCNQPLFKTGSGALTLGTIGVSGNLTVNGGTMTANSVISGSAAVTVNNGSTLTLGGANTHVFPTVVNSGKLFVNGSTAAGSSVRIFGTGTSVLGGTGTINGPVAVNAGASLQPGANAVNAIGALKINNALSLAGTAVMDISNPGSPTGDSVSGLVSVLYGGTLTVNNVGSQSSLVPGNKFTLFSSIVRLGGFTTVTLPPLDSGRAWTNKLAIDGSIEVISLVNTTPTTLTSSVSGGNLNMSWPLDHTGWRLEVQTNALTVGLNNNWSTVAGSTATNAVSAPIAPGNPTVFYRLVYP